MNYRNRLRAAHRAAALLVTIQLLLAGLLSCGRDLPPPAALVIRTPCRQRQTDCRQGWYTTGGQTRLAADTGRRAVLRPVRTGGAELL